MSYQEYRKIVFCGFDSLAEGLRICSEKSKTSGAEIRTATDVIAYRDGAITTYTSRGPAKLTYCFIIHEEDRVSVEAKARYIIDRLAGKKGDLLDSDCPGKKYTNAIFMGAESLEYPERIFEAAYLTLSFEADPVLMDVGADNTRICKIAVSNAPAQIIFSNNNLFYVFNDGTVYTERYSVDPPYTYRLVAYKESSNDVTMNDVPIEPETIFFMPDNADFHFPDAGFGYYEIWHDTRTALDDCLRDSDYGFYLDSLNGFMLAGDGS